MGRKQYPKDLVRYVGDRCPGFGHRFYHSDKVDIVDLLQPGDIVASGILVLDAGCDDVREIVRE
jgi:hypothetical protein